MTDNPFHDAVQPQERITVDVEPERPFFHKQIAAEQYLAQAGSATRQAMFNAGVIGVEDLDDEELRYGRCRDHNGAIPKSSNKTEMLPRDLYDAMVAEHEKRTDEKLRQNLDDALETMVNIMMDDTVEPRDRFEAAKYLFERVKGKTPERVQVAVTKQPWEEVYAGVAKITRAQSMALQQGAIDAEVVSEMHNGDSRVDGTDAMAEGVGASVRSETGTGERRGGEGVEHMATTGVGEQGGQADASMTLRPDTFQPPTPAPSFEQPASSNPVVEQTNAERIRASREAAADLAARRKAAKDRIQAAKKRRIIKRAMGLDLPDGKGAIADTQSKLANAMDTQPPP